MPKNWLSKSSISDWAAENWSRALSLDLEVRIANSGVFPVFSCWKKIDPFMSWLFLFSKFWGLLKCGTMTGHREANGVLRPENRIFAPTKEATTKNVIRCHRFVPVVNLSVPSLQRHLHLIHASGKGRHGEADRDHFASMCLVISSVSLDQEKLQPNLGSSKISTRCNYKTIRYSKWLRGLSHPKSKLDQSNECNPAPSCQACVSPPATSIFQYASDSESKWKSVKVGESFRKVKLHLHLEAKARISGVNLRTTTTLVFFWITHTDQVKKWENHGK